MNSVISASGRWMRCLLTAWVISCLQGSGARGDVRIVGPAGEPVAGAHVTVLLPASVSSPELFGSPRSTATSDALGALPFALPSLSGSRVLIDAADYAPLLIALDSSIPPTLLRLERGETLRGSVAGDGELPPGPGSACATWTALALAGQKPMTARRCGDVGADGSWTIAALPHGEVEVELAIPGYLPLAARTSVPSPGLVLALRAGERALVRVEGVSGRAQAEARVECAGAVATTTDADGEAWVAMPGESTSCGASHPLEGEAPAVTIAAPRRTPQVLTLGASATFVGRILGEDGTVPADARFFLVERFVETSGHRTRPVQARLDDEGVFRLPLATPGTYALRVEAPGWLAVVTDPVALARGERIDLGLLGLRRGAGVTAMLLHAGNGMPLAGAVVSARPAGRARLLLAGKVGAIAFTDDEGRFVVAGLPVGRYVVEARAPGLAPWIDEFDLAAERVEDLGALMLEPPVRVSGRIFAEDEAPFADARVDFLRSPFRDGEPVASSMTNSEGRFAAVDLAPGPYRALVSAGRLLLDQELEIPRGIDRFALALALAVRSLRVLGRVDEGGAPVAGGEVTLKSVSSTEFALGVVVANRGGTDEQRWAGRPPAPAGAAVSSDGLFRIDDAPVGRAQLSYFGASGLRATRLVDLADDGEVALAIELDGGELAGSVLDRDSRRGLEAELELVDERSTAIARVASDGSGAFLLPGVPAGTYRLFARARGYRSNESNPVVVTDLGAAPVVVEMEPADEARLIVRLTRPDGSRAAATALVLLDPAGRSLRALPADITGRLGLSELAPGRVSLVWADPLAGTGATRLFALGEGERELALTLELGRDLVVRCSGEDCAGSRVPWFALLTADSLDLAPYLLRSSAIAYSEEGRARLGRLAPGTYTLVASARGTRLEKRFEVTTGPGEIEVTLPRR